MNENTNVPPLPAAEKPKDMPKQWHERIDGEMNGETTFKAMKAEILELRPLAAAHLARQAQAGAEKPSAEDRCVEADGCPTERAVLQRFWREHHASAQAAQADVRDAALEEAAKVCEGMEWEIVAPFTLSAEDMAQNEAFQNCAAAIRALKRPADDSQPAVGGAA